MQFKSQRYTHLRMSIHRILHFISNLLLVNFVCYKVLSFFFFNFNGYQYVTELIGFITIGELLQQELFKGKKVALRTRISLQK